MRVRDFEDPAEEDYERIEGERRDREGRADRLDEKGPSGMYVPPHYTRLRRDLDELLSRSQED